MRSVLPALLGIIVLLGPAAASAEACECVEPRGCGPEDADLVFVGRILDVWKGPDHLVARFQVERAARGGRVGQITAVRTGLGGSAHCDLDFRPGTRWLIAGQHTAGSTSRDYAGRGTPYWAGFCGGSFRIADGDSGSVFPARSDIGGRVLRFDGYMSALPRIAGLRVWVSTPGGVIAARTDRDGDFLLRDVPLDSPLPLHVDAPAGEEAYGIRLGPWTPEGCGLLSVIVRPARPDRAR
jgi:hypothetical protein